MNMRLLAILFLAVSPGTHAQGTLNAWETFAERLEGTKTISGQGDDILGDRVNLSNGSLSFQVTDVDLPGNDGLPVRITRNYVLSNGFTNLEGMMVDWEIDLPYINGQTTSGWEVGYPATGNRCTSDGVPEVPYPFTLAEVWQGIVMNMPGYQGELLRTLPATTRPGDGPTYRWTGGDQIHVSCLPTTKNGSGEGFLARAPDGTRYWFDWMAQKGREGVKRVEVRGVGQPNVTHHLVRRNNFLYVSRIEDRFGNYVNFTYSNAWNQPARLTAITASDGRALTLSYSNNRVSSISNGTRVWTYGYDTTGPSAQTLTQVLLPDSSAWTIDLKPLHKRVRYLLAYPAGEVIRTCFDNEVPQNSNEVLIGAVTHPSGARGTFRVEIREHGRSSVPISCTGVRSLTPGGGTGGNDPNDDINLWAISAYSWTLTRKTLDGPGLPAMTWNYSYTPNVSYYFHPGTSYGWPMCPAGFDCSQPPCTSPSCAQASVTHVSGPEGKWVRYHHGNTYRYNEGKLVKVETGTGSTTLSTTAYTYDLSQANQAYPARYGDTRQFAGEGFSDMYHRPLLSEQTTRQGTTFTRTHIQFNAFAKPLVTQRASSLGQHVTETVTYENNLTRWVLSQVKTVSCTSSSQPGCISSPLIRQVSFDPTWAVPLTEQRFGQNVLTRTWNTTATVASGQRGTLYSVADGKGNLTTLSNWYRGVPRSIKHPATPEAPAGATQTAVVNARGEIEEVADELGYATGYSYDPMGRLSGITWPTGDSTTWTPTTRSFVKVNTAEFGIPAGHWRLTESTGNAVKDTYYDALWRPVLTRERDASNSATTRYVKRAFDSEGRETFVSYASASSTPTTGIWTGYDALGRPTSVSSDSEQGLLTTTTQYLPGFRTQVTSPLGYQTNTWYQAFDQPTFDAPTSISEPGGVTTTINRDAFGKPLSVTRSGYWNSTWQSLTRHFVYNPQQRLCKRVDPESGATLLDYDAAGNLLWSARSASLTNTTTCQTGSVGASIKSQRGYDARSRLSWISHPAGTANESFTYYADGALNTASNADGGTWTYAYNKRRLPTSESLALGGRTFAIGYGYTGLGDVSTLTYPSGLSVSFNPNALGQPQQAGTYASAATYHPNGSLAGFTYGNGLTHSRSLNARGLPLRVRDTFGASARLDYQYAYDKHGNPTQVTDYTTPAPWNETRSLAYDARDRMIQATAPNIYGVELYEYDPLDNVRRMAGLPNGQGGYAVDFRFQYDASQRLTGINDPGGAQQWGFTLNTFGETLTRAGQGQHWSYQWNAAGRMTRADRIYAGSTWETYVYDAHGHRSRSTRNTGTTRHQVYSRAGQLLYTEDTKDNQRIDYVYLGNKLVAQRSRPISTSTATTTWHHTDHLGSANLETNAAGTQTLRTIRMPYGSPYDGQYREGPGYAGHVTDTQTNLTYMQQRYYDPVALRFLSPDPVDVNPTNGSNFNRYWYANNNPYRFVDPDGRSPQDQWFGHGEADFRDWLHQEKQNMGRRHDFTKEEMSELKKQWEAEGRPRGKGGRSSKGGMRRSMRGAVSVGTLMRFNTLTIAVEAILHSPSLNEGEDERLAERQRIHDQSISEPVGIVNVGEIVPAPSERELPDIPSKKKLPKENDDL